MCDQHWMPVVLSSCFLSWPKYWGPLPHVRAVKEHPSGVRMSVYLGTLGLGCFLGQGWRRNTGRARRDRGLKQWQEFGSSEDRSRDMFDPQEPINWSNHFLSGLREGGGNWDTEWLKNLPALGSLRWQVPFALSIRAGVLEQTSIAVTSNKGVNASAWNKHGANVHDIKRTFVTATRILKETVGSQEERPDQLARKHGRDTAGLKKNKEEKMKNK